MATTSTWGYVDQTVVRPTVRRAQDDGLFVERRNRQKAAAHRVERKMAQKMGLSKLATRPRPSTHGHEEAHALGKPHPDIDGDEHGHGHDGGVEEAKSPDADAAAAAAAAAADADADAEDAKRHTHFYDGRQHAWGWRPDPKSTGEHSTTTCHGTGSAYASARLQPSNLAFRRRMERARSECKRPAREASTRAGEQIPMVTARDTPLSEEMLDGLCELDESTKGLVRHSQAWLEKTARLQTAQAVPEMPYREPAKRARVLCFLCDKEVGIASLPHHHQKCLVRWDRRVGLPPQTLEMTDPRAIPTEPGRDLVEYNKRAKYMYDNYVMPKCPNCCKSFSTTSLVCHMRECCAHKPKLIAEYEEKYNPELYQALGQWLIGGSNRDIKAPRQPNLVPKQGTRHVKISFAYKPGKGDPKAVRDWRKKPVVTQRNRHDPVLQKARAMTQMKDEEDARRELQGT